ncbi:MAG: GntR family transcriptional regulator [Micromonosporaceae bacterium]
MLAESTAAALQPLAGPAASLTDQALHAIRQAVRNGALQPGHLYSAYQVAAMLGVSRSPVREALMRLAEAGMVRFERNRGFRIVIPGPADIAEIFQLRLLLEVPAARQAARRVSSDLLAALRLELAQMRAAALDHDEALFMRHDQKLHELILRAAGNGRMVSLVGNLRDITRILGASTVDRSRDLGAIADEHEPIIDAIATGDAAAAGETMMYHVSHTGKLLLAQAAAETGIQVRAQDLWARVEPL